MWLDTKKKMISKNTTSIIGVILIEAVPEASNLGLRTFQASYGG
jgi:hypothetical protein